MLERERVGPERSGDGASDARSRRAEAGIDPSLGRRGVEGSHRDRVRDAGDLAGGRADDEQRRRVQRPADVGEEGGEPEGDLVDIIDEQDRRLVEHGLEEPPHRPPGLVDAGYAAVDRGQVGESLDETVAVRQMPDQPLEDRTSGRGRLIARESRDALDQLLDRPSIDRADDRRLAAEPPDHDVRERCRELCEHPGPADPDLADHRDAHRAAFVTHGGEPRHQVGELALPTDERRLARADGFDRGGCLGGAHGGRSQVPERTERRCLRPVVERLDHRRAFGEREDLLTRHDRSRRRQRL